MGEPGRCDRVLYRESREHTLESREHTLESREHILRTWKRSRTHTSSGTRNGARYPRSTSDKRRFASSSPTTSSVSGSKRNALPRRYEAFARWTSAQEMCPSWMGAFNSSAFRLRTHAMKLAK